MRMAIINNRIHFVRLLLENGVSLREFLKDDDELLKLYNDVRLTLYFDVTSSFLCNVFISM